MFPGEMQCLVSICVLNSGKIEAENVARYVVPETSRVNIVV